MSPETREFLLTAALHIVLTVVTAGLIIATIIAVSGCSHEPMPVAPTVLTEPLAVECPAAKVRTPDPALLAPLSLDAPSLRDAPGDDYLIARGDAERAITALRACSNRIEQWKAWAAPAP